jgi:hypothetical protein
LWENINKNDAVMFLIIELEKRFLTTKEHPKLSFYVKVAPSKRLLALFSTTPCGSYINS